VCGKPHRKSSNAYLIPMKSESANIRDELAEKLSAIAKANRLSKARVIELAIENLVEEVRKTGRLPVPKMEIDALTGVA
jgi:hypothetical protein